MADFAVVISYKLPDNEIASSIVLDCVDDVRITGNATITTQPMVNGDEIADHMFKHGKTLALSGSFDINSKTTIVEGFGSNKLQNFENLFERIQNDAIECTIYKISTHNEKDIRFLKRENMVLENFVWTEKINTLQFSMNFKQILFTEVVEYEVNISDEFLPNVTEPTTSSFTNTLIDWSKVDATVIEILKQEGLVSTAFLNALATMANNETVIGGLVLAGAGVAAAAAWGLAAAGLLSNPVGWVVGIGLAVAAGITFLVSGIVKAIEDAKRRRKYVIEIFEWSDDQNKNEKEVERFVDFMNEIHNAFNEINSLFDIYQISENRAQEAMISVGDDYYIFTFTENNTANKNSSDRWSLSIENITKTKTKQLASLSAALNDFSQCSLTNYLIKTDNNVRIYLMHPQTDTYGNKLTGLNNADLTQYYIVACHFDVEQFNELTTDIIKAHIFREGAY